jgi:HlyD family secretion protein
MKRMAWGIGLLLLCVAGAAAYFRIDADAATPRLMTSKATRGAIVQGVSSTGTLQPVDTVEVGTQVSGTIKTLGANFNSIVKKGQVIATLDPALFQSQVEQSRASVARLRADLEQSKVQVKDAQQKLSRAKALQGEQLIAQSDFDAASIAAEAAAAAVKSQEAQLGQAEAALRQSEVSLSNSIIRTPVDGIVLSRNVDAYGEQRFLGTVREVRLQPTTTNNVVTYTTVIDVPNPDQKLKPGMTATVTIEVARADDVVRVPAAAVRFQPTQDVLVAINGPSAADANGAAAAGASANGNASANANTADASARRAARAANRAANGENTASSSNGSWSGNRASAGENASTSAGATSASNTSTTASASATPRSRAVVWTMVDGRLSPVRVTTGLSDGVQVALLNTSLQPGTEVVTGLVKASTATATASTSQSSSPLMPTMPRRSNGSGGGGGPRS